MEARNFHHSDLRMGVGIYAYQRLHRMLGQLRNLLGILGLPEQPVDARPAQFSRSHYRYAKLAADARNVRELRRLF